MIRSRKANSSICFVRSVTFAVDILCCLASMKQILVQMYSVNLFHRYSVIIMVLLYDGFRLLWFFLNSYLKMKSVLSWCEKFLGFFPLKKKLKPLFQNPLNFTYVISGWWAFIWWLCFLLLHVYPLQVHVYIINCNSKLWEKLQTLVSTDKYISWYLHYYMCINNKILENYNYIDFDLNFQFFKEDIYKQHCSPFIYKCIILAVHAWW